MHDADIFVHTNIIYNTHLYQLVKLNMDIYLTPIQDAELLNTAIAYK